MLTWIFSLAAPLWAATPAMSPSTAVSRGERRIQIGILLRADEVSLLANGRYAIVDREGRAHELPQGKPLRLEPAKKALRLGPYLLSKESRLKPRDEGAAVAIEGKSYGGTLVLRLDPGGKTLTIVEEIGIEDYLLGVLPHEMDPGWPLEALKAQAVVARTFAYTQLGKYRKDGFDLTTDTRSQVYGGRGTERPAVLKAVAETRGEVMGYKGELLNVYYHACCGGHTENAARAWGGDAPPPLWGVKDRYCYDSPLRSWKAFFSYTQLVNALLKQRLSGEPLKRFEIGRVDIAGYVTHFVARIGDETIRVKGSELRAALGGTLLRSVRIVKLKKMRKGVEFFGRGAGHGVGLCQWGARLQADRRRNYEQILAFYFPGATLSVIDE